MGKGFLGGKQASLLNAPNIRLDRSLNIRGSLVDALDFLRSDELIRHAVS